MGKKKTYYDYLRQELGELVEQLELPNLYKQSLKQRWLDQVVWADKKAAECRRWHYRLRLTTIIGGVILPALVGLNFELAKENEALRKWFPYVPFTLSQVIAISAAIEEFCRFGDRWRDYRKMSENLKGEGWEYLQLTGAYQSSESHTQGYTLFASRVESIIKEDVQSYVAQLIQQQAKQEEKIEKYLEKAKEVSEDKTLFARPVEPVRSAIASADTAPAAVLESAPNAVVEEAALVDVPQQAETNGHAPTAPVEAAPVIPTVGAAGMLKTRQSTIFKLNPLSSEELAENQKFAIAEGQCFGLQAYKDGGNNHLYVTFNQGVGPENRNSWYVCLPDVEITDKNGQVVANPVAPVMIAVPTVSAAPAIVSTNGAIKLKVPYFSQRDNAVDWWRTCNTSSCAMVAKYLGAKISGDDEYFNYVIKYGDTTDHGAQTGALTEIGIKSTWNTTLGLDDLDKSLASGLPIVIGILHKGPLERPEGDGHMIVVIGRDENGDYIVNDPYGDLQSGYSDHDGGGLIYHRRVLERRWTVDGPNDGWGRLFYGNSIPNAPAVAAKNGSAAVAKAVANSGIPVFSVPQQQNTIPTALINQSSDAIPKCGIDLIKKFEGYGTKLPDGRAQAYADPIYGWSVPTIGYGTTVYPDGRKVKQGDIITHDEAEKYLVAHIEEMCKSPMEKIPTWGKMNTNQRGALYSFADNLGAGFYGDPDFQSITKVCDSTELWNDLQWVKAQFVKYCNPGTAAADGLRRRREAEAKLFCS
jgi:GH24 family phage-related lysozyme (muramidase)/uncharacterized protein YfcZ (UPF0381/DUF406 family)